MKLINTEQNFSEMSWHDTIIHGIGFNPDEYELFFDIDYMYQLIKPVRPSTFFTYMISPTTLVFRNVYDYSCEIESDYSQLIMSIERNNETTSRNIKNIKDEKEWSWNIDLLSGVINFKSTGYIQYARKHPVHWERQKFTYKERNGISFEKTELT